jgi:N-methylhydantoinase A/oxoprolinase/acetone carboxylase beta subunit
MEFRAFVELVRSKITEKLSTEILSRFLSEKLGDTVAFDCKTCLLLLDKVLGKEVIPEVDLKAVVGPPIIAIGAPVETYFPPVASQLNARLVIPEHAEVANAIGAITGSIIETVEVLIDPIYSPAGIQCYTVHSPVEKVDFDDLNSAAAYARGTAEKLAREKAIQAGAGQQVEVRVERDDQTAAEGYGGSDFLLASSIKATAFGKPNVFSDTGS